MKIYCEDYDTGLYMGYEGPVEVIVTDDILDQEGNVSIPKGVLAEEYFSFGNWNIRSPQVYVKAALDLNDEVLFARQDFPKVAQLSIPMNAMIYSETPWYGKVREATTEDKKLVSKIHKQMEKDMKAYNKKSDQAKKKLQNRYKEYLNKVKETVVQSVPVDGISFEGKETERYYALYIYRFSSLIKVLSIDSYTPDKWEKQYNEITNFLNGLTCIQ